VKEIERRAQSLSSVLASPVSEGDYAEKGRRAEFRRSVLVRMSVCQSPYPSPRKLEGVIAKLEPLSDQRTLIRFLRNVDNAKILGGFAQELADAITDYQVRATSTTVVFTENPARFRYNKECTSGRGRSITTQERFIPPQGQSVMILGTYSTIPRTSAMIPGMSSIIPRISW
jgi:hypothetical protein